MAKKALIVGINTYPTAPLRGCVNDAMMVSEMLTKHFGFTAQEKRMLTDASATTKNIMNRLEWLVDDAKPGDIIHFHYSGHGSQMIDTDYDKRLEPDGKDEIICPVDLDWRDNVIKDDDLKQVFDKVPSGVFLTVVLDCCHSGSGMDHGVQYQPLGTVTEAREFGPDSPNRARLLPMPADIANRGMGLELKPRPRAIQHATRDVDQTGLMISGCQSTQTSADAWIDNQYCGAATYSFVSVMEKHEYDITYKQMVDEMNQFMVSHKFTQRPELNGNLDLFNTKVLNGKKSEGSVEEIEVVEPTPVDPALIQTAPETSGISKKDKKKMIMAAVIGGMIILGLLFATGVISP